MSADASPAVFAMYNIKTRRSFSREHRENCYTVFNTQCSYTPSPGSYTCAALYVLLCMPSRSAVVLRHAFFQLSLFSVLVFLLNVEALGTDVRRNDRTMHESVHEAGED